jgi:ABC-2 type transport system ATP-binding protein
MAGIIEVRGLCGSYGDLKAVQNISFTVAKGEVFGMLGPDGTGKTTTMEIVEGLQEFDSGSVEVLGLYIGWDSRHIEARFLGCLIGDVRFFH